MKRNKAVAVLVFGLVLVAQVAQAQLESVRGYTRRDGTYVAPYYRTHADSSPYNNLSYRGYPSQQPGYVSPGYHSYSSGNMYSAPTTLPYTYRYTTPTPLYTPSYCSPWQHTTSGGDWNW